MIALAIILAVLVGVSLGLLGGGLAGLFILGIFTRRANSAGAIIGAGAGVKEGAVIPPRSRPGSDTPHRTCFWVGRPAAWAPRSGSA